MTSAKPEPTAGQARFSEGEQDFLAAALPAGTIEAGNVLVPGPRGFSDVVIIGICVAVDLIGQLMVYFLPGHSLTEQIGQGFVIAMLLVIGQASLLWWRRSKPALVLVGVGAVEVLGAALAQIPALDISWDNRMAVVFAAYALGAWGRKAGHRWATVILVGLVLLANSQLQARQLADNPFELSPDSLAVLAAFNALTLLLIPFIIGIQVRAWKIQKLTLQKQLEAVQREKVMRAELAVSEERARMARELHDIAAHHLSGIVLRAQAAKLQVDSDPAEAKAGLEVITQEGRQALDNIRRVVGLLRNAEAGEELTPQPGMIDIPELVAQARQFGATVTYQTVGDLDAVEAETGRTAYRVVQEALANIRRHAPQEPVTVTIAVQAKRLQLSVANPLPREFRAGAVQLGGGLVGMRERVAHLHGRVTAGPSYGQWQVQATLPLPKPAWDTKPGWTLKSGPDLKSGPASDRD